MDNLILKRSVIALAMTLSMCVLAAGQATKSPAAKPAAEDLTWLKSSPAYAELLVKKTDMLAELESLAVEYTEEYPRTKEIRFVLTLFDRDFARIGKLKPADSSKLTLALGKLMLRRIELETELWNLQKTYQDAHPDVKRAKKKIAIYDTAIGEILN